MRKQRKRIYAALLCICMILSLVSTPVLAAETGQMPNPQTTTEELGSLESISGNEAAAALNGLSVLAANGVKEVTTAEELTSALENSANDTVKLTADITIGTTLTISRTVTLDLNGNVLKMTGSGSVIKVESGGNLTIQDSNTTTLHNFTPNGDGLWVLDTSGSKIVNGGIITGGTGMPPGTNYARGGGVYVSPGAALTMNGGSIVGCRAGNDGQGGGVQVAFGGNSSIISTFTMNGGSIIGCTAFVGGGVHVASTCKFTMQPGSVIRNCTARIGGGVCIENSYSFGPGVFTMEGGEISLCNANSGGGVYNTGTFTMSGGAIGTEGGNDTSHVYNSDSWYAILTISGNAKIYTNIANGSKLNADGGEVFGDVTNGISSSFDPVITGSDGAAASTSFSGAVTNDNKGTIEKGTFTGTITNNDGTVLGGDFSGATLTGTLVITFDPNNGDQPSTQKVNWSKDGAALTAPAPTKEGHSLDGWYYDNNGTETKWNFDTDKARYTMTLTAQWKANTYTITLSKDSGTIAQGKEVTGYTYGTETVLPTADDITREGYTFHGWYADSSFSGSPVMKITNTETGNKTFYAKWTPNTINYIVEHYKTNGSGYALDETEYFTGKTGDTVTATPKTYDGYTYNPAISTASGTLKGNSSPDDIMTLKLYYGVNVYTVSLDTNGGTIAPGKEVTNYTYGTGAVLQTASDITREGYRFDGWYADNSFSGSPVTEITGTDTGDKTFYAKWTRNTTPITPGGTVRYIVEHYKADGSGYTLAETEHSTGSIGNIITATPKVYEGFTYNAAISTASGTLKKISGPEDIVTLKLYYDVSVYTVTVDGSYAEASGAGHYATKDTVTISAGTRDGYKFSGWTSSDGVTFADAGSATTTFTMPDRAVTVTANWETTDSGSEEKADREAPSPVVKNSPSYVTYTVQAGDTLWAIARKYGCSIAEIVVTNSDRIKNPNLIHAGWQLKIPRSGATVTGSTPDAVLPENKKSGTYIVGQGDTLWAIARKCGCSVAEIISLNRELIHDPALIFPGWELKVPQD